jgi:hypothetical protein
MVLLSTVSV